MNAPDLETILARLNFVDSPEGRIAELKLTLDEAHYLQDMFGTPLSEWVGECRSPVGTYLWARIEAAGYDAAPTCYSTLLGTKDRSYDVQIDIGPLLKRQLLLPA